jgi:tetratricopeptide (TPR) repeat protein
MAAQGPPRHPLALTLLDLSRRQQDGLVRVGSRRIVMRAGAVADVVPAEEDVSLEQFLVQAGRATAAQLDQAHAEANGGSTPEALVRMGVLNDRTLRECRRALWLDRLVQALSDDDEPRVEPDDGQGPRGEFGTVPLVLDALARRAAKGDAESVGACADRRLVWEPVPDAELARRWSELDGDTEVRIADMLARSPAGAARVAALIGAGFARMDAAESVPPPPPRRPSLIPPGGTTGPSAPPDGSLPPPREPVLRLDPGEGATTLAPEDLVEPVWQPPPATASLDDPLDALERDIARLEQSGAPGPERARAWRALARAWQREYGSLEEAARAWREAASADPSDRTALEEAALLCAAMGSTDLARAYAQAGVAAAPPGADAARAWRRLAELALRGGDVPAAVEALRHATEADPERADSPLWLVRLYRQVGDMAGVVEWARRAAGRLRERRPDRARALLAWATTLQPDSVDLLTEYAEALAADGYDEAAVSLLSEAARASPDPHQRRQLLLDAAERAEAAGRPDLAAERLLEAFAADPHAEALHEPLVADLEASGDAALHAILLEEVAEVALAEHRAEWLLRAARAQSDLPGGGEWAEELLARALTDHPGEAAVLRALERHAEAVGDPAVLADALERAAGRAMLEGVPEAVPLLRRLAQVTEASVGSPTRALWAWECVGGLDPSDPETAAEVARLRSVAEVSHELVHEAERQLEQATAQERPAIARRLAGELRDHPDESMRAAALYRESLEADPDDAVAASSFERLLRRRGDAGGWAELVRRRAERETSTELRLRHFALLAAIEWGRGHFRAGAEACLRALEIDPGHLPSIARLDRCGHRLDDPDLQHRAVEARTRAAVAVRPRARALVMLAMQLESRGSLELAIETARQAVALDARATDAVALLLRHMAWLSPEEAMSTVDAARSVMGDSPPLLELAVQVAERAGRRPAAEAYLDAWATLMPGDPRVTRWRLSYAVEGDDVPTLVGRAEDALAPGAVDDHTAANVRRALAKLEQLGALAEAAQLAILAADRIADRDPTILALTERLAGLSDRSMHPVAALERRIAHARGDARVEPLRRLAGLHREQGHRAAETRALLRLLADHPRDADTLQRLADIFAETGEVERLLAVLSIRLEAAEDHAQRRTALLDLAAAAASAGGDLDRAMGYLRTLTEQADDAQREDALSAGAGALVALGHAQRAVEFLLEAAQNTPHDVAGRLCERAVAIAERAAQDMDLALATAGRGLALAPRSGALLMTFERLALEMGDVATARSTYDALADAAMGPHGRRALRYRQARWLERAGDLPGALAAYAQAFELQPGAGAVFGAIERLAVELDDLRPLVDAHLAVAKRTPDADQRVELTRRAAGYLEGSLGDPARAFEVLEDVWKATGSEALLEPLRALARRMAQEGGGDADALRDRVISQLRSWADQTWDGAAKVDLLRHAARVMAEDAGDIRGATLVVDEVAQLATDEDVPPDAIANALCDLAEWHLRGAAPHEAAPPLQRAKALAPDHPRVQSLLARLPGDDATRAAEPRSGTPEPAPDAGHADMGGSEPPPDAAPGPAADESEAGPPPGTSPEGTVDEAEQLGCVLASDPSRQRDAVEVLLGVVRREPSRILSLRLLHDLARRMELRALGDTVSAILSMFDPRIEPPDERALVGLGRRLPDQAATIRGTAPAGLRALGLLWRHAPNLFRRRTSDYGLLGTDRISDLGLRPLSRAFKAVTDILEPGEVSLFVHDTEHEAVHLVPTQPPTLVAPLGAEAEERTLLFRLGRGVELARPEHLLAAVLEPADLATLLASIQAAFGPAEGARDVPRQAAELASELWHTVPAKAQAELRDLLAEAGGAFDSDDLVARAMGAAVRAGLAVAGGVLPSVAGLLWDEPTLAQASPDTEEGYVVACRVSPALVELLRFSLSDEYLAARAEAST